MQWRRKCYSQGLTGFFRITLSHDSLESHFLVNFALVQHHKYSLTELNEMIPWERQIYIELLKNWIQEQETEAKQREAERH